jgi:glycine cleavage system aminomethyltransferase T
VELRARDRQGRTGRDAAATASEVNRVSQASGQTGQAGQAGQTGQTGRAGQENNWFKFYFASWYKKSPYFRRTVEAGCTSWDLYNHMLIPTLYDDDVKEYWHLLEHVTLWDVAVERQVEITGRDAARFTQLLTPRDLATCAVGQCKYVVLCAPDGGIVNDPILLRLDEDRFWLSLADSDALLYALGVQAFAGLDVRIHEPDVSPLQVQGPKSKPLIRKLFGDEVADLRYYWCAETSLDGIPVVVSRTGWTGEVGYEVYLRDSTYGLDLWDVIMAAGQEFQIRAVAPSDQRRMEAGIFNYGNDMDVTNNPFEVTGLERLVELDNENHVVARQALERVAREGVTKKLVGVRIDGEPLSMWLEDFWPVSIHGRQVGTLTSASFSPRLQINMGYAWVPIDVAAHGTRVEVASPAGSLGAEVVPLPFWDPKKDVPKS